MKKRKGQECDGKGWKIDTRTGPGIGSKRVNGERRRV